MSCWMGTEEAQIWNTVSVNSTGNSSKVHWRRKVDQSTSLNFDFNTSKFALWKSKDLNEFSSKLGTIACLLFNGFHENMISTILWSDILVAFELTLATSLSLLVKKRSSMLLPLVGKRTYWLTKWSEWNSEEELQIVAHQGFPLEKLYAFPNQ